MLDLGDTVPDFTLPLAKADGTKAPVAFHSLLGKGPVVIAFFPLAFTGTCTKEMCDLRDNPAVLDHVGATAVGFSIDTAPTNVHFAKAHDLRHGIFSDPNREVVHKIWDTMTVAGVHHTAKRGYLVVDRHGKVVDKWITLTPGEWPGIKPLEEAVARAK